MNHLHLEKFGIRFLCEEYAVALPMNHTTLSNVYGVFIAQRLLQIHQSVLEHQPFRVILLLTSVLLHGTGFVQIISASSNSSCSLCQGSIVEVTWASWFIGHVFPSALAMCAPYSCSDHSS